VLKVVINAITEELLKVYGGKTLHTGYKFDWKSHRDIALFLPFYRQLHESLLLAEEKKSNQGSVPTSGRPSSRDATLEKVSDNIANHFLSAAFEHSGVGDYFWWATQHNSPLNLKHRGYSHFRIL